MYLIFLCLEAEVIGKLSLYLLPLDLFFIVKIYLRIKKIYLRLRIRLLSSNWRY